MASVMFYCAMFMQVYVHVIDGSCFNRNEPLPVSLKGVVKTEDIRPYATYEMEHKYEDVSHGQAQEESDYSEVVIGPRIKLNPKWSTAADGKYPPLALSSSQSATGSHFPVLSEHNGPVATNDFDLVPYYVHCHTHSVQSSATESEDESVYVNY